MVKLDSPCSNHKTLENNFSWPAHIEYLSDSDFFNAQSKISVDLRHTLGAKKFNYILLDKTARVIRPQAIFTRSKSKTKLFYSKSSSRFGGGNKFTAVTWVLVAWFFGTLQSRRGTRHASPARVPAHRGLNFWPRRNGAKQYKSLRIYILILTLTFTSKKKLEVSILCWIFKLKCSVIKFLRNDALIGRILVNQ